MSHNSILNVMDRLQHHFYVTVSSWFSGESCSSILSWFTENIKLGDSWSTATVSCWPANAIELILLHNTIILPASGKWPWHWRIESPPSLSLYISFYAFEYWILLLLFNIIQVFNVIDIMQLILCVLLCIDRLFFLQQMFKSFLNNNLICPFK